MNFSFVLVCIASGGGDELGRGWGAVIITQNSLVVSFLAVL